MSSVFLNKSLSKTKLFPMVQGPNYAYIMQMLRQAQVNKFSAFEGRVNKGEIGYFPPLKGSKYPIHADNQLK